MRVALGTAVVLGLSPNVRMEIAPRTAHFLAGDTCSHGCAYCAENSGTIARISWPEFPLGEILKKDFSSFSRACLQVAGDGLAEALQAIPKLPVPASVTLRAQGMQDIDAVFAAGADRACIPIDACSEELSEKTGRGSLESTLRLLEQASKKYPGRMSTHIIVGLGEKESETVQIMQKMAGLGVTAALFAFTPAKGSIMEHASPCHIGQYRRMQAARWKIFSGGRGPAWDPQFNSQGQLLNPPDAPADAFETSGCGGCNRPYFDSPASHLYNYPRHLTAAEHSSAKSKMALYEGKKIHKAGKLIKIRLEHDSATKTVVSCEIAGDFFVHPEDALQKVEDALAGTPLEKTELSSRIAKALEGAQALGFDPDSLSDAIMGAAQ